MSKFIIFILSNIYFRILILIISVAYGMYQSIHLAWVSDDSYISFVYARNLYLGNGLVFNIGETVEGYSNFLWTILLTSSYPLNFRIEDLAIGLGIFFYMGSILLLPNIYLSLAYSLFYHGAVFATSGLETSLYTFAILLGYRFYTQKKWNQLICVYSLMILIRPEGFFFLFAAIILVAINNHRIHENTRESVEDKNRENWKILLKNTLIQYKFGIIIMFFFSSIYIAKAIYYGDLLPNTYYAKASEGQYFLQGLTYLRLFFQEYPMMSSFLLFGVVFSRSYFSWVVIFYLIYIVYVGGDFMFTRFIVPVVPVAIAITWDRLNEAGHVWTERFPKFGKYFSRFIILLLIFSPLLRSKIYESDAIALWAQTGVGEERMFYSELGDKKLEYTSIFQGKYSFAFYGAQAHFIYKMSPGLAIESSTGLTDRFIARQKLNTRTKIGHEKKAPLQYLRDRKINIVMGDFYPEINESSRNIIYHWNGHPLVWKMLTYDKELIQKMSEDKNFDLSQLKPNEWRDP